MTGFLIGAATGSFCFLIGFMTAALMTAAKDDKGDPDA